MKSRTIGMGMALAVAASVAAGCADTGEVEADAVEATGGALTNINGRTFDQTTQCTVTLPNGSLPTTMHCCPNGTAMEGIYNSGGGIFRCAPFPASGGRFLDTTTQRTFTSNIIGGGSTTMKACPVGTVMVGYHGGLNRVACQATSVSLTMNYRDDNTQAFTGPPWNVSMHVCGSGYAMAGFHAGQNKLGCSSDSGPVIP